MTTSGDYYRPLDDDRWPNRVLVTPVRCPMMLACAGGPEPGDASCNEGHSGLLCGICMEGFFRSDGGCRRCPESIQQSNTWSYILLALLTAQAAFAILSSFRHELSHTERVAGHHPSRRSPSWVEHKMQSALQSFLAARFEIATHCKILLGFLQTMNAFAALITSVGLLHSAAFSHGSMCRLI